MRSRVDGREAFAGTGSRPLSGAGRAVVFVHGAGQDHTVWVLPARHFARRGLDVLAPDLPGHGYSEGPALPAIPDMADWVVRFMDAAGLGDSTLVGHSMGSLVAMEVALRRPERVSGLVLVATSVPMPVSEELLTAARDDTPAACRMIVGWGHAAAARLGGNPSIGMWMTGQALRLLERAGPGVLHGDLLACARYAPDWKRVSALRTPALLLLGQRDAMTPARAAGRLAKALPRSTAVTFPGCGHMVMAERPEEVLDALRTFIDDPSLTG